MRPKRLERIMSEPTAPESGSAGPPARQKPSPWIFAGLLALLAGWFVVTQVIQHTGPPIAWIHNDLPAAEAAAQDTGRRVFLMLHEPGCPVTAGNERDLFSTRFARERLAKMVCCRIELSETDPLRQRFGVRGQPLMLVLRPGLAAPLARLEGKIDELQFKTYVDPGQVGEPE
jgi:hypothetical protein